MTQMIKLGSESWKEYCGFLDLDISDFLEIQNRLLLKQIDLLKSCSFGKKILHGKNPKTVEEFRSLVPLTKYSDYFPELIEKREDILPTKPIFWVKTSGRSSEYPVKWVPVTDEFRHIFSVVL